MALNIVTKEQPLHIQNVIVFIYGDPGIGKTSLAFTAKNPILFDFDKGAYRAFDRKDTVQINSWSDVAQFTADDLKGYDTIVIDTAGRVLDLITDNLKHDVKNIRRGSNELSMQGYGKLGSIFTNWLKMLRNMGKDIVILAHAGEDKDGENIIKRPDMVGGSKKEVYKVADMMGYMTVRQGVNGSETTVLFKPSTTHLAKDSGQIGDVTISHISQNPHQLAEFIQATKDKINAMSDSQRAYMQAQNDLDGVRSELMNATTADDYNAVLANLPIEHLLLEQMKKDLWQHAKSAGFDFDKESKCFIKVDE